MGVLGDLSRNVETDLLPYCDEIMQLLIHNLGSNEVHRTIKPQVRRCDWQLSKDPCMRCLCGQLPARFCSSAWRGADWADV